ncbi:hypothetical protein [Kiloniella antarctica]|uniref:Uncharacterized protein n=1 Tax=Kiloniella antarctica TaxID=1550907 RepID=A0ABW5BIU1_9PROT
MIKFSKSLSIVAVLFVFLQSNQASADQDIEHYTIPPKAHGVILIDNLKEGNLIYMRGFVGKGTYFSRNKQGEVCSISPVPIIAGDFEETDISIHKNNHLKIVIYSSEISKLLFEGKQIESGDYDTENGRPLEALLIETGLPFSIPFILNPRRSWTSWFRGELKKPKCVLSNHS